MNLIPPLENCIGSTTRQFAHHNHPFTTSFEFLLFSSLQFWEREREKEWEMKNCWVLFERSWLLTVVIAGMVGMAILINNFSWTSSNSLLCPLSGAYTRPDHSDDSVAPTWLIDTLHYATSRVVPHQSLAEIKISFNVLQFLAPCNFLVYGLFSPFFSLRP